MGENLEGRVAAQFSSLYLTLVSVLVGFVMSDLLSQVHDRMILWPLTLETARTWAQILGNMLAVLSAWVTYSHLGLLRKRVPTIWDTADALLVLVTIPLNAATGLHEGAPWFFWASAYSLLGITAVRINLRQATREPALAHLPRIGRFGGPYTLVYIGILGHMAMAIASWLKLTSPLVELIATATAPIAATFVTILFIREWRAAVLNPPTQTAAADGG